MENHTCSAYGLYKGALAGVNWKRNNRQHWRDNIRLASFNHTSWPCESVAQQQYCIKISPRYPKASNDAQHRSLELICCLLTVWMWSISHYRTVNLNNTCQIPDLFKESSLTFNVFGLLRSTFVSFPLCISQARWIGQKIFAYLNFNTCNVLLKSQWVFWKSIRC